MLDKTGEHLSEITSPLSQSILFALPLVCGAAALILGAIFRRSVGLRIPLVLLSSIAGLSACALIVFGLLSTPRVEIFQNGFRTAIFNTQDDAKAQDGSWSPVPWALPRTGGPALEICGVGGVNQKRRVLARQTQRGRGQLFVDFPGSLRNRPNFEAFSVPIESNTEILYKGEKTEITWKTEKDEEKVVIRHSNGSTETVGAGSLFYPNARQFPDSDQSDLNRSGIFLSRFDKDRGQRAHLLVINPGINSDGVDNKEKLIVNGKAYSPNLEFSSQPDPDLLRVTRWNSVQQRFQSHTFKLSFQRNFVEGELVKVSRFDRLRLPMEFLKRDDTVHFLVSDWLYQNPTPSPAQLGSGSPSNFDSPSNFVPDIENRISKYDTSNRPGTQVALTFDDGPVEGTTPKLLDILRQHQVPATFFVLGKNAIKNPELMKRIRDDGHEIGNHTWDHSTAWYLKADEQIGRSNQAIGETGSLPRFFRPPYGAMGNSNKWLAGKIASKWSMETIYWSVDPQEFRKSASDDEVIRDVVSNIHDGAVVLMHDIHLRTIRTVPEIIHNLKRQKVEFLTLSALKAVSKGEHIPAHRGTVRLPTTSGLPSYLTLPYLPADASGSGTRIEIVDEKVKLFSPEKISERENGGWELPLGSGGAVYLSTGTLGPSMLMVALVLAATLITILASVSLGNLQGSFIVAILGLVLTRFVLAMSADHVFPDDVNLWNPTPLESTNWLVDNTTAIALLVPILLCAIILPSSFIGVQDLIGNRLIGRFRLRRWFGFLLGLVLLFCGLAFVWIAGAGERIGSIQKSAFYIPIIILCTSWIVGVGGARGAESRTLTERCWPVFAALFFLMAIIHCMFAVFRQDLGAILVLLPATWLFLCYASSQANWLWRAALWILAGMSVVWGFRFISSFLAAIHHDDYPFDIIPDVDAIKAVAGILVVIVTLLCLRALPRHTARRVGLPILGMSILLAVGVQFIPINPIARKLIIPKSESRKEALYSQYLRFRSVDRDFLNSEGTQRAMEISEEQKIVDVYGMGGWFGDGFGTLPFDRSRYNFLNDYVVSTFVRGQFGLTGVLALAFWQLSLLFYSTRLTLPRNSRNSLITARLAFWEAGGKLSCWVIGFISIYMIISNLGFPWAPLTGKNVFLLGLNSSSDVLESSILIFMICAAAASVQKERRSTLA